MLAMQATTLNLSIILHLMHCLKLYIYCVHDKVKSNPGKVKYLNLPSIEPFLLPNFFQCHAFSLIFFCEISGALFDSCN